MVEGVGILMSKVVFYHHFVPLAFDDGLLVNQELNKSPLFFIGYIMRLDVDAIVYVANQLLRGATHCAARSELLAKCKLLGHVRAYKPL